MLRTMGQGFLLVAILSALMAWMFANRQSYPKQVAPQPTPPSVANNAWSSADSPSVQTPTHHEPVLEYPLQEEDRISNSWAPFAETAAPTQSPPTRLPLHMTWKTPVGCDFNGFFVETLGYVRELERRADSFHLDIGHCSEDMLRKVGREDAAALRRLQGKQGQPESPQSVLIQHMWPRDYAAFDPKRRPRLVIGRSMCESQILPRSEAEACARVDRVWVPTTWHADVYVQAGVPRSKLAVVPESVDAAFFDRSSVAPASAPSSSPARPVRFLSVFKWEHRKGWDVLLEAYFSEFRHTPRDAVELVVKSYKPGWEPGPSDLLVQMDGFARKKFRASLSELPRVIWMSNNDISRAEMREAYSRADAFVLPTRGEGWGLPVLEAMSMSVPAIVTNFSGPTGFVTSENGYPLPFERIDNQGFAVPSTRALRQLMRRVFSNPLEAAAKGKVARQDVLSRFTPQVVVDTMVNEVYTALSMKKFKNN